MKNTKFKPGKSGNPKGRPRGIKNVTTLACEALLDGEAEELTRKAIELAKNGDITALRLCFERVIPTRKGRPVVFSMPELSNPRDLTAVASALLTSVSEGRISPEESSAVIPLIETARKALETDEILVRLEKLEARRFDN